MFQHPITGTFPFFNEGDPAFVLNEINLITGLDIKTVTQFFRYRNLSFGAQHGHGAVSLLFVRLVRIRACPVQLRYLVACII